MKIGELAKSTGLSVRALHHYDEMGLLKPSMRTQSGHRIYTENDILRLHKIISLKQLDLPLEQVGEIIGQPVSFIQETLDRQLEKLESEIEQKQVIHRRIRAASDYVRLKDQVELPELVNVIKDLVLNEKYFSKEQWLDFEKRGNELGTEKVKEALDEFPKLIQQVQHEMDSATPPDHPKVVKLINRWKELGELFTGNDPEVLEQAKRMHSENPGLKERHGVTPELIEYIKQAKQSMSLDN